jgi:hypothetical protein
MTRRSALHTVGPVAGVVVEQRALVQYQSLVESVDEVA